MKKRCKIGIIALIIIIVVIIFFYLILRRVPAVTYQVQEVDLEAHWGKISGSLSYPSEMLPEMGVCVATIDNQELYCTYEMIASEVYTYGYGYEVSVPPGDYYVFAHLVDDSNRKVGYTNEYKAYYSQFVNCGMDISCTSHDPIKVTVGSKEHVTRIDPIDWYNY